jgi:hypothetical protein
MIAPSSRYAQGEAMWVSTQDPDVGRGNKQTVYLNTVIYLTNPYSVALVRETDDMTMFAFTAYGDPRRWWVIADANPQVFHPWDARPGQSVRVPS